MARETREFTYRDGAGRDVLVEIDFDAGAAALTLASRARATGRPGASVLGGAVKVRIKLVSKAIGE